jgi:ketosteroid isomerase-like protein
MDIKTFISDWIAASNAFDTKRYLGFFLQDAILDDRSVGRKFKGHAGIKDYFESYFIGYNTNTELVNLKIIDDQKASHLEVKFSGDFPEGKIGGSFDFEFSNGKIAFVKAHLIH